MMYNKLMRRVIRNRDMSIVDCRMASVECRLPLIVVHKAFERRRLIVHRRRLLDDYNRPCM